VVRADPSTIEVLFGVAFELVDQPGFGVALVLKRDVRDDGVEVSCAERDNAVLVLPAERLRYEFRLTLAEQMR